MTPTVHYIHHRFNIQQL